MNKDELFNLVEFYFSEIGYYHTKNDSVEELKLWFDYYAIDYKNDFESFKLFAVIIKFCKERLK